MFSIFAHTLHSPRLAPHFFPLWRKKNRASIQSHCMGATLPILMQLMELDMVPLAVFPSTEPRLLYFATPNTQQTYSAWRNSETFIPVSWTPPLTFSRADTPSWRGAIPWAVSPSAPALPPSSTPLSTLPKLAITSSRPTHSTEEPTPNSTTSYRPLASKFVSWMPKIPQTLQPQQMRTPEPFFANRVPIPPFRYATWTSSLRVLMSWVCLWLLTLLFRRLTCVGLLIMVRISLFRHWLNGWEAMEFVLEGSLLMGASLIGKGGIILCMTRLIKVMEGWWVKYHTCILYLPEKGLAWLIMCTFNFVIYWMRECCNIAYGQCAFFDNCFLLL